MRICTALVESALRFVSKTSVSYETSSKSSKSPKRAFRRDFLQKSRVDARHPRRGLLGHKRGRRFDHTFERSTRAILAEGHPRPLKIRNTLHV